MIPVTASIRPVATIGRTGLTMPRNKEGTDPLLPLPPATNQAIAGGNVTSDRVPSDRIPDASESAEDGNVDGEGKYTLADNHNSLPSTRKAGNNRMWQGTQDANMTDTSNTEGPQRSN